MIEVNYLPTLKHYVITCPVMIVVWFQVFLLPYQEIPNSMFGFFVSILYLYRWLLWSYYFKVRNLLKNLFLFQFFSVRESLFPRNVKISRMGWSAKVSDLKVCGEKKHKMQNNYLFLLLFELPWSDEFFIKGSFDSSRKWLNKKKEKKIRNIEMIIS